MSVRSINNIYRRVFLLSLIMTLYFQSSAQNSRDEDLLEALNKHVCFDTVQIESLKLSLNSVSIDLSSVNTEIRRLQMGVIEEDSIHSEIKMLFIERKKIQERKKHKIRSIMNKEQIQDFDNFIEKNKKFAKYFGLASHNCKSCAASEKNKD